MLSRRNVRIKVMQVLYAVNRNKYEQSLEKNALRFYDRMVEDSHKLFLYNILAFMRVAQYARQDKIRKQGKLRPSKEDLAFSTVFVDNEYLTSLAENQMLRLKIDRARLGQQLDADFVRQLYLEFAKEENYQSFILIENPSKEAFVEIYLEFYKFLIKNDTFISMLEDYFPLWNVDKSLIVGAMKKTIKALPIEEDFLDAFAPQHETIREFGEKLLTKVVRADKELLDIIEPNLNNWDANRVAVLDMIIIKMALSEFLYFSSIPTKVTLNEFVELAKLYSTDKSKDFINGILDRLLKNLDKKGLIRKEGRGLK